MYAKVFSQIYDGTLCTKGPWEALVTFQQLLVLADMEGNVDMTQSAISRRTTIPLEIIQRGIAELVKPDPDSRTPAEEGRRLIPLAEGRTWGWRIVNYVHYRELKREEDRREYHRQYWHKRKASNSTDSTDSTATQHTQPNQPKQKQKQIQKPEPTVPPPLGKKPTGAKTPSVPCPFDALVDAYHVALPALPRVRLRDGPTWEDRKRTMRSVWAWVLSSSKGDGTPRASTGDQALEWFRSYFERAAENDWLMGRTAKSEEHRNWQCDLDFLLSKKGMKAVIEKTLAAA